MGEQFIFTPENLLDNIHKLGTWSSYGLAEEALKHYFPDEYPDEYSYDFISTKKEVELLNRLGCNSWQDAIIKYQNEVGYDAPNGFHPQAVNEF